MSRASDMFNSLPFDERKKFRGVLIEHQIRDYRLEMSRAAAAHRNHMNEARAHIKNCEKALDEWEREMASQSDTADAKP